MESININELSMIGIFYAAAAFIMSSSRNNALLPPAVYLIDFQAFQHGTEDYTVKEMCIIDVSKPTRPFHTLYLPPCCWYELSREQKRTYYYQTRSLHKLNWDEGYTKFCRECLQRDMERWLFGSSNPVLSVFYVMGQQKKEYLQRLLPHYNFVNYQDAFNVNSWADLPEAPPTARCPHRDHGDYCSVKKCYSMYWHYLTI